MSELEQLDRLETDLTSNKSGVHANVARAAKKKLTATIARMPSWKRALGGYRGAKMKHKREAARRGSDT